MSVASRPVSTGKTRTCPHCKATILESLSICPGCMHHLRFDSEAAKRQVAAAPALRVEGIIRHPPNEQPLEYFVIIAIRNDRGEEVTRQVVNVGALQAAEKRTFTMSVEVLPPSAPVPPQKQNSSHWDVQDSCDSLAAPAACACTGEDGYAASCCSATAHRPRGGCCHLRCTAGARRRRQRPAAKAPDSASAGAEQSSRHACPACQAAERLRVQAAQSGPAKAATS